MFIMPTGFSVPYIFKFGLVVVCYTGRFITLHVYYYGWLLFQEAVQLEEVGTQTLLNNIFH